MDRCCMPHAERVREAIRMRSSRLADGLAEGLAEEIIARKRLNRYELVTVIGLQHVP